MDSTKIYRLKSEAQKQRPHKLLWMLWFDGKSISSFHSPKTHNNYIYDFFSAQIQTSSLQDASYGWEAT